AVASVAPGVHQEVGRLAQNRITGPRGLQGVAENRPGPRALVLGHGWDAECTGLRRFLERNQITYKLVNPDTDDAEGQCGGPLPPPDEMPAIRRLRGQGVGGPTARRGAHVLGLHAQVERPGSYGVPR